MSDYATPGDVYRITAVHLHIGQFAGQKPTASFRASAGYTFEEHGPGVLMRDESGKRARLLTWSAIREVEYERAGAEEGS